jgi:hypothetical protein
MKLDLGIDIVEVYTSKLIYVSGFSHITSAYKSLKYKSTLPSLPYEISFIYGLIYD